MLSNFKIGTRLTLAFAIILVFVLAMAIFSFIKMAAIQSNLEHITKSDVVKMSLANDALKGFADLKEALLSMSLAKTEEQRAEENRSAGEARKKYREALDTLGKNETNQQEKEILSKIDEAIKPAGVANNKVVELAMAGKSAEAGQHYITVAMPLNDKLDNEFKGMLDYENKNIELRYNEAISNYNSARIILAAITGVILILCISVAFGITRSITVPVANLESQADRLAQGDLRVTISNNSRDEIGHLSNSFVRMAENFRNIINQVSITSSQVASAASQLNSTAEQIATGAEEVAAQAATVATAGEEMSATSGDIAQNCQLAAEGAQRASQSAQRGTVVVEKPLR